MPVAPYPVWWAPRLVRWHKERGPSSMDEGPLSGVRWSALRRGRGGGRWGGRGATGEVDVRGGGRRVAHLAQEDAGDEGGELVDGPLAVLVDRLHRYFLVGQGDGASIDPEDLAVDVPGVVAAEPDGHRRDKGRVVHRRQLGTAHLGAGATCALLNARRGAQLPG